MDELALVVLEQQDVALATSVRRALAADAPQQLGALLRSTALAEALTVFEPPEVRTLVLLSDDVFTTPPTLGSNHAQRWQSISREAALTEIQLW
ncbi:MAG: hypothetical protein AAB817_00165, partial [Patescibacteria group bacterium]